MLFRSMYAEIGELARRDGISVTARTTMRAEPVHTAGWLQQAVADTAELLGLPAEDLPKFQRVAVPIWFKWANKDKDAARLFKAQLDIMESPTVGYVTPDMYKGQKLDL